jgi:hypothetical protein
MMDFMQASDAIRNLAKLFRHMEGAADALESIGSLEQASVEKKRILEEYEIKIGNVQSVIAAHESELKAVVERSEQAVADARLRADTIVDEAHTNAAQINTKAQEDAAKALAGARQDADRMIAHANAERDVAVAITAAARAEKGGLDLSIGVAKVELAAINECITVARSQIAKMLGGE